MPVSDLTPDELHRIYGPWASPTVPELAGLMAGYPGRWWVAGGHAIEAFTGQRRPHGDLDPSIPRADLPLLRAHLAGALDLWAANQETLTILLPGDPHTLDAECENIWARPSGADPWQLDLILMSGNPTHWVFKRDDRIALPWSAITWLKDGAPYLRPEIQLLHKARGLRPKDQADFDATEPLLDQTQRTWLGSALALAHPGHPWLERLS